MGLSTEELKRLLKDFFLVTLSLLSFVLSILGFWFSVFLSALALFFFIYDLSSVEGSQISLVGKNLLRVLFAVSFGVIIILGDAFLDNFEASMLGISGNTILTSILNFILSRSNEYLVQDPGVQEFISTLSSFLAASLALMLIVAIPFVYNYWSKRLLHLSHNDMGLYSRACLRLFALTTFLSLGGSLYTTATIMAFIMLSIVYRMVKAKERINIFEWIKKAVELRKEVMKSFWLNWLRADKSPQTDWLSSLYLPSILFLIINVRFLSYFDVSQDIFLLLIFLPVLIAYLGIRSGWENWIKSSIILIPYTLAIVMLIVDPFSIPVLNHYYSEAVELYTHWPEGYGPVNPFVSFIANVGIEELQWFFTSLAILALGFFSPFSSMVDFSAMKKNADGVRRWYLYSIIYAILSFTVVAIVTVYLFPFLLLDRLILLAGVFLLILLVLSAEYEQSMQRCSCKKTHNPFF